METPWGNLLVSDAHVHFFSHRFFTLLGAQRGLSPDDVKPLLGWEMPSPAAEDLAGAWVQELDGAGVARAALIGSIHGDDSSVTAAVQAHPKRFYGFFMVNPLASDAPQMVEKALSGGLLQGICLFPGMHRYSLHDERVTTLVESAAARPGCVVFVHCGLLSVGVRKKLGLESPFDMRFSNPLEVHGLALRYPKVPFIVPHFGAGMFRETLMLADLCPNVHLDTSSSNGWMRYQEYGCDLESVFRRALDVCGAKRLLFGTDSSYFPRGWHRAIFDRQVEVLRRIGIGDSDARAIFGDNLQRLLARS